MASDDKKNESLRKAALDYHSFPAPGKLEIKPTKPLANQRDLSRAYSPGVAEACIEIKKEMSAAYKYTSKSNLVAVISNGTAWSNIFESLFQLYLTQVKSIYLLGGFEPNTKSRFWSKKNSRS